MTFPDWMRANLAMTMAFVALLGGGTGGWMAGTVRVAYFDDRLDDGGRRLVALEDQAKIAVHYPDRLDDNARRIKILESRVDTLDNDRHERDERRIKLANDLADINSKIGTLQGQAKFIGDYLQVSVVGRGARH